MFYSIRHSTRFRYSDAVRQSVMEVRMQPRSEGNQSVRQFELTTEPRARIFAHRDFMHNIVHHFDIPGAHTQMAVIAEALVEVSTPPALPDTLGPDAWRQLDDMVEHGDYWDFLMPSRFSRPTELLVGFRREIGLERGEDPLATICRLNSTMYEGFNYVQQVTRVDSPIDDALAARQGVCQDFTHIMIALVRELGVPARYVSGYLYHRSDTKDRSVADATHAWVETLLPGLGWVGFDPTNNLVVGDRHIRTAVGRDYADVTPTRGTFKGQAMQEMKVAVHVTPADAPKPEEVEPVTSAPWIVMMEPPLSAVEDTEMLTHQQQQQ